MRVLVIQHTSACPPARVGDWLVEAGASLTIAAAHLGDPVPESPAGFDALLVLGGEMGGYDDEAYPWLTPTKNLLREAVRMETPTLGICLGHQLLAIACGGAVEKSPVGQQIGLRPVSGAGAPKDRLFADLPADASSAHWNSDIVAQVPPDAEVLTTTEAGFQAMRVGAAAWGVQFHPEVGPDAIADWAKSDVAAGRLSQERVDAALAEIAAADAHSIATWRAFIHRFAVLA